MVSLAGGRHEAGVSVIQDRHRPAPGESSERLEELQERAIPADGKPVQSRFMRCKDARVMLDGRSTLERCEHAGWFTPLRPGKRLTIFKREDVEATQLRVSWGELPELARFFPAGF